MKNDYDMRGFTLVEIVIVVAIVAILTTLVAPNFFAWVPNMRVKSAARDLFSEMQKTRVEAIKSNHDWAIIFDAANNTYSVYSDSGADSDWALTGDNTITKTIDLASYKSGVEFGHGSAATAVSGGFPAGGVGYTSHSLVFNSQGVGNGDGYVYLENNKGTAYAVGTQVSGVVMFKQWLGGTWQ